MKNKYSNRTTIKLGAATYQIERSFTGTRTVSDILVEKLVSDRKNEVRSECSTADRAEKECGLL